MKAPDYLPPKVLGGLDVSGYFRFCGMSAFFPPPRIKWPVRYSVWGKPDHRAMGNEKIILLGGKKELRIARFFCRNQAISSKALPMLSAARMAAYTLSGSTGRAAYCGAYRPRRRPGDLHDLLLVDLFDAQIGQRRGQADGFAEVEDFGKLIHAGVLRISCTSVPKATFRRDTWRGFREWR